MGFVMSFSFSDLQIRRGFGVYVDGLLLPTCLRGKCFGLDGFIVSCAVFAGLFSGFVVGLEVGRRGQHWLYVVMSQRSCDRMRTVWECSL